MGSETILIGYISEIWLGHTSKNRSIRRWNRKVISELPKLDSWPPLNRGMFSFSGADGVRGGYLGSIIYFGGCYKGIEWEWNEWLAKYEALLLKLYWTESAIYLHIDGSFPPYQFSWQVDYDSFQGFLVEPPKLPKNWNFEGSFRSSPW